MWFHFIKYKMRQNQCILQIDYKRQKYSGNANILPSPFAIPLVFRWLSALMHKALILLTLSLKTPNWEPFSTMLSYIVLLFCFCLQTPTYDNYVLFYLCSCLLIAILPLDSKYHEDRHDMCLVHYYNPSTLQVPGMEKAFMLVRHFQTSN